jgi:Tol biopolymer transport system component
LYAANFRLFRLPLDKLRPVLFASGGDDFTTNRAGTISAWGAPGCPLCGGPISVKPLAGGRTTSIGGRKVKNSSPALSPDGRRVAFSRTFWGKAAGEYDQPAGIWVSSTAGGPLRQLTRSGFSPSWSPDGRRIAYVDGSILRLVSASGRSNVLLLRGNVAGDLPSAWSADSRRLAIINSNGQLLVVSVATHRAKAVTGRAIGSVNGFAWSPNSATLLVTAQSKTTACTLWAVNASGSAKRVRRTC